MATSKNAEREQRAARDRLRNYRARQTVHEMRLRRRTRDNLAAVIGVVAIVTIATVSQVVYFTSGPGMPEPTPSASDAPETETGNLGDVPSAEIAENRTWTGLLEINEVDLGIRIDGDLAPQAASVFISLAQDGYYDQNACQRLTSADQLKVIQCGQPNLTGSDDPGFTFGPLENVPEDGIYPAGTIAMARADTPESQSTQFFITYEDSYLDPSGGGYTVFGAVTDGLDEFIAQVASGGVAEGGASPTDGQPAIPAVISSITLE
ncbi:peptidyl-prolyl cis-trans isomerase B (cyclophilin B) [Marisediminicola sp. UYEF4]|uniref:peptidylprolyl isomerase n=1 Tax=Marisediminicola sp. UYEF4 TaxID=1756384 RepID=UPI00339134F7